MLVKGATADLRFWYHSDIQLSVIQSGGNSPEKLGHQWKIVLFPDNNSSLRSSQTNHDDLIKWKHFPHYWPFVRGIHRSPGEFPTQRPVTQSFHVLFELRLNKRLSKRSWGWWFEMLSCPLWRHCNDVLLHLYDFVISRLILISDCETIFINIDH